MCLQVGRWTMKVVNFRWRFIKREGDMVNLEGVLVVGNKPLIM